ncbi:MAG: hypothetical protein WBY75_18655 [Terracidiphilus sp.]
MPEQFENSKESKLKDEAVSQVTAEQRAEKRIERVADKAAEQSTKTEQRYDSDHSIFSK